MSDLQRCRICLRTDSRFYSLNEYNLKIYYELISGTLICENDTLLQYFCFECATLLHKFNSFRDKCHYSNEVLRKLEWSSSMTHKALSDIVMKNNPILEHGKLTINATLHSFSSVPEVDMKQKFADDHEIYSGDNFEKPNTNPVSEEIDIPIENDTKDVECNEVKTEESPTKSPPPPPKLYTFVFPTVTRREEEKIKRQNQESRIKKKKRQITLTKLKRQEVVETRHRNPKGLAFLDSAYWKKSTLSEKEAAKEFEAKSKLEKYLTANFKCTDCYKGFSQKSMLDRHVPQRHGQHLGPIVCRFCKMRFKSKGILTRHIVRHYTRYKCLRCNLVFNLETSALYHEEYHAGVVRKCSHCDQEFKHVTTYYSHLRTHRSKHMCSVCGESFVSQLGLRLHTHSKHANGPKNPNSEDNTFCEVCQIRFRTKEAYKTHLLHSAMHIDDNSGLQEDDTTKETEAARDDKDSEKKAAGDSKDDEKDQNLKPHIERKSRVEKTLSAARKRNERAPRCGKTAKKPTTCYQCGEHFETQGACLKHHLVAHPRTSFHAPQERVICEICGASLAPGSIKAHKNHHTRSKMYTCDTCGRSFTASTMLRIHLVTHTGEKKYGCTLCDKRFTQGGSLNLHYRTFHLKQPYPKRNRRRRNNDKPNVDITVFDGEEQ